MRVNLLTLVFDIKHWSSFKVSSDNALRDIIPNPYLCFTFWIEARYEIIVNNYCLVSRQVVKSFFVWYLRMVFWDRTEWSRFILVSVKQRECCTFVCQILHFVSCKFVISFSPRCSEWQKRNSVFHFRNWNGNKIAKDKNLRSSEMIDRIIRRDNLVSLYKPYVVKSFCLVPKSYQVNKK